MPLPPPPGAPRAGLSIVPLADLDAPDRELVELAEASSRNASAPYSRFQVGAALRSADGTVVTGCNVENASYGLTYCAEVGAVMAAVQRRKLPIEAVAVYGRLGGPDAPGPRQGRPLLPCGRCRQVLAEMALAGGRSFRIICSDPARGKAVVGSVSDFLPGALEDGLLQAVGQSPAPAG
jgi:cytidine deaminase